MATTTLATPQAQPVQGQWTYDDYLQLPDDGNRYEIIEGVLYGTNAPNSDHQFTVTEVAAELRNFVKAHKLGQVLHLKYIWPTGHGQCNQMCSLFAENGGPKTV